MKIKSFAPILSAIGIVVSVPSAVTPARASDLAKCIYNVVAATANINPGKNVVVFNATKSYSYTPPNFSTSTCNGVPIRIWVFNKGSFINKDAKGFETWGYKGRCTRSGADDRILTCN